MIFYISQWLILAVIRNEANRAEPNAGEYERAISTFAFDLTLFQFQCLNDPLREQFDGLFAMVIQVVLPGPSFLRQLLW